MADQTFTLEQLARRSGMSAEQVRLWRSLGLIWDDGEGTFDVEALERARLLGFAADRGIQAEDIAALTESQGDVLGRFVELIGTSHGPGYSLEEASRRAGLDPGLVQRFWTAGGLGDQPEVLEDDLAAMKAVAVALEAGLPEEALLQIIRVLADALGRVADTESRIFHFYVHERLRATGLTGSELADVVSAASGPLQELVEPSVLYFHRKAWERSLREDLLLHLREDVTPASGSIGEVPVTVLFVDLASFTPLTEAMGDVAAAQVLDRFSELVREAASRCDGRVIKQIGDEFMLVFPSGQAAVACGLYLASRIDQEPQFPAIRMGAHSGTALFREADYLGATVNLAARVAAEAGRGQFLVTDALRRDAEASTSARCLPVGRRELKGVGEPLDLYQVSTAEQREERAVDPVCGMALEGDHRDIYVVWHGREWLFCTETCRSRFVASPERYAEAT